MMRSSRDIMVALLVLPALAHASDTTVITQQNKAFSATELSIPRGRIVTFVNEDTVRHNIAIRNPDGRDQTGIVQSPGATNQITFDEAGLFQVHCLIHPTMHLAVTVR